MFEWLKRLFKRRRDDEEGDFDWDIGGTYQVGEGRSKLDLSVPEQMEQYVRSCCEQMKSATEEIDASSVEFNAVTERLHDLEEIEDLPMEVSEKISDCAARFIDSDKDREWYLQRKNVMSEEAFCRIERHEAELPKAIDELEANEEYKVLVKKDLKNLEGEKMSYRFRRNELLGSESTLKGLVTVVVVTIAFTLLLLAVLQFKLKLSVSLGYLLCMAAGAIALTAIFINYTSIHNERKKAERKLNYAIEVQNKVKIRYVNITGLIDYAYAKYKVNSSNELNMLWEKYIKEKRERERFKEIDEQMTAAGEELLSILKACRVKKPELWLRQARALVDRREMVEIRHELVARRGSLRKRINYNEDNRSELKNEVKQLVMDYPQMAPMIMDIVSEYD